ncbi:MAG TPA: tyrosine-type recombinase/integrase [Solirubrobacteraceae bacterium]|jgi:integrase
MASTTRGKNAGIEIRHARSCAARNQGRCGCSPRYRAEAYDSRQGKRVYKNFKTLAEAKAWRADAQVALRKGTLTAARSATLDEAAATWLAGAVNGSVRNRSGDVYKPSVVRGYEQALRLRVLPELGAAQLSKIRRAELQALVDRLLVAGHDPSTIRNTLLPVRAIFRRAVARGEVAVNPTTGLELPAVRGRRERIASPEEARRLLDALERDRALWATALYSGLRMGELRALEWDGVDFDRGLIHVRRTWDHKEGPVEPKSRAGSRSVPLAGILRADLAAHRLACEWRDGLVFGRTPDSAFNPGTINNRAGRAWEEAGLERITLHECRHTFASLMIAAGVNAKALSVYMGHASVMVTFDLYGHLMPGNEAEAAELLDDFLVRATQPY